MKADLNKLICKAGLDKKAERVMVINLEGLTVVSDYFIVMSGGSKAQVKAISDHIEEELAKVGEKAIKVDGYNDARWIVLDYGDVLVHVFYEEDRLFYNLERLWNTGSNTFIYSE